MLRLRNIFILAAFVLWILPLGVFIKASDEKKVCAGKRAICLCTKVVKAQTNEGKKIVLAHPAGFPKENSAPGGNASHFLAASFQQQHSLTGLVLSRHDSSQYSFLLAKPVEHVPKV